MDNNNKNKKRNRQKNKKYQNNNYQNPANAGKNENTATEELKSEVEEVKNEAAEETTETPVLEPQAAETQIVSENHSDENSQVKAEQVSEKKSDKGFALKDILSGEATALSPENIKIIAITALKILLPVAACAIVIAVIFSVVNARKNKEASDVAFTTEEGTEAQKAVILPEEPLAENAYPDVNSLMNAFYKALADGDMDTVMALRDYNDDTAIITYQKKSEFIESYDDVTCYTKNGIDENSYFVYVSYEVKIEGIDTKAPGLNAFYVYTNEDGNLVIDGDMEESIKAALKLVTSQDDVVDLYTKIDVSYKEALAADEALNAFMTELPVQVKTEVGEALAQLEAQNSESETQSDTEAIAELSVVSEETEASQESEEQEETLQNKTVNQIVRATDTVNVRSSDSEEADKIGRVTAGTELTRVEERINGWSKVIYEEKEAFIKSDYLEVVSTGAEGDSIGAVKATTNVNVRNSPSEEADKIGVAQADNSYELLENLGEWYKINYKGQTGYVKAEFFE